MNPLGVILFHLTEHITTRIDQEDREESSKSASSEQPIASKSDLEMDKKL